MFDFLFQINAIFYRLIQFYMNKIFILALVGTIVVAQACGSGEVRINGACTLVSYIQGCVQYISSNQCALCEYGYRISGSKCQYTQKPVTDCCVLINQKGNCVQCAPGLYLDGDACSKIERPGCLQGKDLICTNCAKQFQNINGRCFRKIEGCNKYYQNGVCAQCQNNYELIKGLCNEMASIQAPEHCTLANQYGCVECEDGFYLTKQRNCRLNQVGCLKHFRQVCQICSSEFKLINGRCTMQGCTSYSSSGCEKCSSAYTLSQGRCIIDNCLQSSEGNCQICSGQYRLKSGKCYRAAPDRCNGCANGFFIGQNGKCNRVITGCLSYAADGKCTKCQDPFSLTSGVCSVLGCERAGSSGCQICYKPFSLVGGKCLISQCQQHNFQARKCTVCKFGFHLERSVCVKNEPLCYAYSLKGDNEICSQCINEDYILNQDAKCEKRRPGCLYQYGKCISCVSPFRKAEDSSCYIQGCSIYNYDGCSKCIAPYVEKRGSCQIQNCEEVTNKKCTRCFTGYHLIQSGACVQNDQRCAAYLGQNCQKCVSGYILNKQGSCAKQINFCKVQSLDRCIQCQYGFQLSSGRCLKSDQNCGKYDEKLQGCISCNKGYHTESGVCKVDNPSCLIYQIKLATNQYCTKCAQSFVLDAEGKKCLKQVAGCIYNSNGVCSSCKAPFKFDGTKCLIYACNKYSGSGCSECQYPSVREGDKCVIPFCDTYDSGSTKCTVCSPGYKLIQGKCYREDPKCIDYSQKGVCTKCINQYALFEGVCVKEDQSCQIYSKQGGCNKCKPRYYLSPDSICLPEEPGCVYQKGKCVYCNYPFKYFEPAQKCRIDGCLQAVAGGCSKCRVPYQINKNSVCEIPNCITAQDNHCVRCTPGYHLKQGLSCAKDQISCLRYNEDGDCELCDKGWMLMSSGECEVSEDNCIEKSKDKICVACKKEYFVNKYFQCQRNIDNCAQYNNGICANCLNGYYLYQDICFKKTPGCVSYSGKDCVRCRSKYTLRNGECFIFKTPGFHLEGEDDQYDFQITSVDISKSKYDIENLSPISKLGSLFYSSFFNLNYTDPRITSEEQKLYTKGWKAENARNGEYIGYSITEGEPTTFYALQLEAVEGNYIKQFYIQYSLDNVNYIRIEKVFDSEESAKNITTIYFVPIYAKSIRIVVKNFYGWPATKIEFFYYDKLRFQKISNLKSLRYLKESIRSNFVDRMDNQMYINQRIFFNPAKSCENKSVCFTGLELCQPRTVNSVKISTTEGALKSAYITYSIDGSSFNCFEKCRHFVINQKLTENVFILNGLLAKNVRIYPVEWVGTPKIKASYDYS